VLFVKIFSTTNPNPNPNLRDKYEPENIKRILINVASR
jgi:hypothetical protein